MRIALILMISFEIVMSGMRKNKESPIKLTETQADLRISVLPSLRIHRNDFTFIEDPYFKHSVGGQNIKAETRVGVKYDSLYLYVHFECRNNPRMDQNFYTTDNSAMFNQEIFELFISQGPVSAEKYLEIELNPNNALFLGKVTNRLKTDGYFNVERLNTKASGVKHKVKKDQLTDAWIGELQIPFDLINSSNVNSNKVFRLNFYRIISMEDHFEPEWKVSPENAIFGCWSSTMTKKPQFHVPDRFGFLYLD